MSPNVTPGNLPTPTTRRPTPPAIEARAWGWRHGGRRQWAVRNLDLTVQPGEHVLLLGPSGAGKSTLLAALAGVLGSADEGEETGQLLVGGRHPADAHGEVGLVQQDPESNIVLARVGDEVAFGPENLGVPRGLIWPRVRTALDAVGLDLPLDHPTTALSGGQKQRLAIAGSLAMTVDAGASAPDAAHPRLLLLDEPTANLDPVGVREVRDAVVRLARDHDLTLVAVEHRVDVWSEVIDRVLVLDPDGSGLLADGPPGTVFREHRQMLLDAGVWVPGVPTGLAPLARPSRTPAPLIEGIDLAIGHSPGHPVQQHLDVTIGENISTTITGANGAGKTTLALTLAGLLPRLGGEVRVSPDLRAPDRPARRWRRQRAVSGSDPATWRSTDLLTRIGTVFQEPEHQFVANTVRDELGVGLRALGWDADRTQHRVQELLERLRLGPLAEANPFTLSGGEKRRLSVATVLATSPQLLFLDEPTFGQDRTTWLALVGLVRELLDAGHTIVTVTHDADFVDAVAQQRLELSQGGVR